MLSDSKLKFKVRRATLDDIPAVMRVNLESLPEHYWQGFFEYLLENWGEAFLVAEVNGVVVGYAMSRVETVTDPTLVGLPDMGQGRVKKLLGGFLGLRWRVGHLVSIAVLAPYRGMGIGKALLSETIRVMKDVYDVDAIYLEVRVSNEPAIRLYEKFGFRKVTVKKGYYRDGEDAYIMVKTLKPVTT
ncbi:MAG: ribosomal protein S18-alanine N-acetyltransferase [Desulfurococcales archaeon]|nr:ribosomal protein S18-alanine N-acetyltransferase [Desulfurococcales archaeon]